MAVSDAFFVFLPVFGRKNGAFQRILEKNGEFQRMSENVGEYRRTAF